jgi:hypothetical protein
MFELRSGARRKERIARLGFLVGRGKSATEIAIEFGTSSNDVYQQADRLGLSFRDVTNELVVTPSPRAAEVLSAEAKARNITTAELVKRIFEICAAEPHLLGNILDDT